MVNSKKIYVLQLHPEPQIIELNPDGTGSRVIAELAGYNPDGLVIEPNTKSIIWTHMGSATNEAYTEAFNADGGIFRLGPDGRSVQIAGWGQIVTPKQLTADLARGFLYWGDREGMRLMRSRLDGSDVTTLVQSGVFPRDIADARLHCVGVSLDTKEDKIFWTQIGAPDSGTGRILSAGIDLPLGETPDNRSDIVVIAEGLPEPIDLEYSSEDEALYWTDRGNLQGGNSLNRIRFIDGLPQPNETLTTGLDEGIGLALDMENRKAYVSDLGGNVRAIQLDGEHHSATIARLGSLTGIAYGRFPE